MNTDTPRTDEVAWPETGLVEGDFARQLERELTAVTEQRDKEREIYGKSYSAELARSNHYKQQRDRLAEALTRIVNIYENPEKGCIPSSSDMYDEALQSLALAAVKGGSDDRPILRHNGVGEADMYSQKEYAQLMLPQSIPTAKVTDIHFLCIGAVLEPGQWVDWEVAFTYQGEACLGFLQACPAHPYLMHHHQIENCCHE